jgi:hypothetical protein
MASARSASVRRSWFCLRWRPDSSRHLACHRLPWPCSADATRLPSTVRHQRSYTPESAIVVLLGDVLLAKEHKDSPRRIDAAVAAVMAVHRAAELAGAHEPSIYI